MLTGNREYNEIYKKYKNLVLKVAIFIQVIITMRQKT